MGKLRVLIGCEYSGIVRDAFLHLGHDAMSCDLLPTEKPGPHYQGDIFDVIEDGWDLAIFHPPCTYLSVSGMHWTARGLRDPKLTEDALEFVRRLMAAPIERIALENPVSVISSRIRKPDQIIQPWWFGDDASKKTCLWLKNLPRLEHCYTYAIAPRGWKKVMSSADMLDCECCGEPFFPECNTHYADCECIDPTQDEATYKEVDGVLFATLECPPPKMRWSNQCDSGQNKLGPSVDRWKARSLTYQGIANAMAEQYSK